MCVCVITAKCCPGDVLLYGGTTAEEVWSTLPGVYNSMRVVFFDDRRGCKFSHDLHSYHNFALLTAHELDSLSLTELRTLLMQSDDWLLPQVRLTSSGGVFHIRLLEQLQSGSQIKTVASEFPEFIVLTEV